MHVAYPDTRFIQIISQIFRHFLGKGRYQDAFIAFRAHPDFGDQIVNLALHWPHFHRRIDQPGRADNLLADLLRTRQLILRWRGGNIDDLIDTLFKFPQRQRAVVNSGRQPKTMLHQIQLARAVAPEHCAYLRHRNMRFINKQQEIAMEVIQQSGRRFTGSTPGQMPGIVFNAVTAANLCDHFQIMSGAHLQPLRFQQLALTVKPGQLLFQLRLNRLQRPLLLFITGNIMAGRIDLDFVHFLQDLAGHRIGFDDPVDFVSKQLDSDDILAVNRDDLNDIPTYPESAAAEPEIIPGILDANQLAQNLVAIPKVAIFDRQRHAIVILRRTEAVNARDTSHNNNIASLKQ